MADGFNDIRATRVLELIAEFHEIQSKLAEIDDRCHPDDFYVRGYIVLRQCRTDGYNLLQMHQSMSPLENPSPSPEIARAQLGRILLDASARRFRANKICLQAAAATSWVNQRNSILQGQRPHVGHAYQLMHCDQAFEANMANITDNSLYDDLQQRDTDRELWTYEDPSLQAILQWIAENC